jgi:hypothetical protein
MLVRLKITLNQVVAIGMASLIDWRGWKLPELSRNYLITGGPENYNPIFVTPWREVL